jgi:DNA-binding NtrC family response regulator
MAVAIVDDDLDLVVRLLEALKSEEVQTRLLVNGGDTYGALLLRDTCHANSDLNLPDLTGIDLARKLKHFSPHMLVCICTRPCGDGYEQGGAFLVEKPAGVEALVELLREII